MISGLTLKLHKLTRLLDTPPKPIWLLTIGLIGSVSVILIGLGWWLNKGDWIYPTQTQVIGVVDKVLAGPTTVGQTFVAYQAGLEAIEVRLKLSPPQNDRSIILHVRHSPDATQDLRQATVSAKNLNNDSWVRFSFDPISDSRLTYYYFFLEAPDLTPNNEIGLYYGPPDAYLDGALYLNSLPQEKQLAFHLVYSRPAMVWDFLSSFIWFILGLGAIVLVFVLPGWGLLRLFIPEGHYHWTEGVSVAVGLSLAIYPILMLWTNLAGLHLGSLYVWGAIILSGGGLLWHYRPWRFRSGQIFPTLEAWLSSQTLWPSIAFISVIMLVGASRFFMIQDLDMPLWHDSVHHTIIVQRILEQGGLFQSWGTYAPYQTFSNQFGFHANIAAWQWVTGLELPKAVLSGGQILNLFAVLTLYPLAYRINGFWSGVVTILVAGLLTQFPNHYTNWGRYPQLAGQAILPIAAWWIFIVLTEDKVRRGFITYILGGGLLAAGTILAYYRLAFHYLAFLFAITLLLFKPNRVISRRLNWLGFLAVGITMGVLIFPWLQHIMSRPQLGISLPGNPLTNLSPGFWERIQTVYIGWPASQAMVIFLGTVTAVWLRGRTALPVVWLWTLVSLPLLRLIRLPGSSLIQEFTITTSLYMPIALIWGVIIGFLINYLFAKKWWTASLVALALIAISLWRLPTLSATANRAFDLGGRSDIRAAEWIKQSLPDEALFLINGIIYTDGYSALAGDSGSWLPILSDRRVVIPPQYALLIEQPNTPGYSQAVNELVQHLFDVSPITQKGKETICNFPEPITHIYLGQRRGLVDEALPYPPPHAMMPAELLLQDPDFRLIYHQDRVMIFEFNRTFCS